jgi:hypothetical protein
VFLLPIGREAAELKTESDFYIRIRERVLSKCLFDERLVLADRSILECPVEWRTPENVITPAPPTTQ